MHAGFQSEVNSSQPIEFHFLRITAHDSTNMDAVIAMMERMGWLKAYSPIQFSPPPTPTPPPVSPAPALARTKAPESPPQALEAIPVVTPQAEQASNTPAPAKPAVVGKSKLFTTLARKHIQGLRRNPKVKKGSARDAYNALALFLLVIGDKPVGDITDSDVEHFADILAWWPTGGINKPCFEGMTPSEIAKHVKANESIKHWALSTQRKQVLYVKAFFHYLVHDCKEISEDPTRYLNMHRYVEDKPTQKNTFKKAEIHTLFDRERMSQLDNPLHYFGPLFAFYTGMRCNEIAQLLVCDIQLVEMLDEDGNPQSLYCIEVTDKGKGQSVKSAYSRRWLPLHSKLIEAGALEYVKELEKLGCKELFPGTSWAGTGPGHALSKWFNGEYMRKECGIKLERTTLHCFRHTLNTLADRNRVPEGVMVSINGHSSGTDVRRKHYVSRADVLECQNYLEKLPFPALDLPTYNFEQFKACVTRAISEKASMERRIQEGAPLPPKRGRKVKENWFDDPKWGTSENGDVMDKDIDA